MKTQKLNDDKLDETKETMCDSMLKDNFEKNTFFCGVVEGFYGRPWTAEQRRDLFEKMKRWGMNTYMYAPKDDFKHRAYWRELYTVEEAEYLTGLIQAAKENGVIFVYALSPGLDIGYSNPKEVACLKRKLEQVAQFGCSAFALLFDDIEPDISEADKELFQSFGHAQVSVTNEVYQHLSQPMFLFCPTEYSASRAVPDVRNSEYLNTIGSKLMPGIHILWTGPKVISKVITIESILELSEVLKRPPIIWDNLHANDYDQKRVFLGPYSGRSTDLIPNLRGVLTNPNCEYETNFIPIQTLAMWSKCNQDGKRDLSTNDSVSADIKLETENENGSVEDVPSHLSPDTYHPSQALKVAIKEWLNEFYVSKNAYGRIVPGPFLPSPVPSCPPCPPPTLVNPCPPAPAINTCIGVTMTTSVPCQQVPFGGNPSNPLEGDPSAFQPLSSDLVNSLVSGNLPPLLQADSKNDVTLEPMDCNPSPRSNECIQERIAEKEKQESENIVSSTVCTEDSGKPVDGTEEMITESTDISNCGKEEEVKQLTKDDVSLLVDLFYLPFGHGSHGLQLLQEFFFLKTNGHIVSEHRKKSHEKPQTPEIEEWYQRAAKFDEMTKNLSRLLMRLTFIPNRSLLYDLYPYLWDIKGVVSLLNSYLKWLALGRVPPAVPGYIPPTCTWFSKGYKEAFMSGDQEPWLFRGGLTAELQRLLPLESVTDLFLYKPPEPPSAKVYTIRPYLASDEAAVYEVCRKTCDDGLDGSDVFPDSPDLIGGKLVGAFLCLSPEYCFVVEDEDGVCGYALAALDAQQFLKKTEIAWIPELCRKYPKPKKEDGDMLTPAEEIISSFHNYKTSVPDLVFKHHPSTLRMSLLPTVTDSSLPKRLLACVFSALKANDLTSSSDEDSSMRESSRTVSDIDSTQPGCELVIPPVKFGSHGVYCEVTVGDKNIMDFYFKLGFLEIALQGNVSDDEIYLGRIF